METPLEQNVREIFLQDDAGYDTTQAISRIQTIDFRDRASHKRRLWAMLGTSGTAIAGGIVAAVLLLSSGVAPAYAGWASAPAQPTPQAVAAASKACNTGYTSDFNGQPQNTTFFIGQPVLTEARGIFTAVVAVTNGKLYECLEGGNQEDVHADFNFAVHQFGKVGALPGPDQLSVPYTTQDGVGAGRNPEEGHWPQNTARPGPNATPSQLQQWRLRMRATLSGGGYGPSVLGQTGTDVSAVSFAFANGDTVTATVQNGWYFAWWPWLSPPTTVTVTTSSGTTSSPVAGGSPRQSVVPACQPGTSGCVFAGTTASS